jgi:7 transmembrane receptor (rhodopsin family)
MAADSEVANISNSTDATMLTTNERSGAHTDDDKPFTDDTRSSILLIDPNLDARNPMIVKSALLIVVSLIGFIGNGTALATIRRTPKLHTKTYALLASLTMSDLLAGMTLLWIVGNELIIFVFSENPCSYVVLVAALAWPSRAPVAITIMHIGLISVERYIVVVHPLHYNMWITDTTIKVMVAFGWMSRVFYVRHT